MAVTGSAIKTEVMAMPLEKSVAWSRLVTPIRDSLLVRTMSPRRGGGCGKGREGVLPGGALGPQKLLFHCREEQLEGAERPSGEDHVARPQALLGTREPG